jgi:DNA-binding transcriptional regulator GbsR (MarR family)
VNPVTHQGDVRHRFFSSIWSTVPFEQFVLIGSNELNIRNEMILSPVMEKFVDCWGEMGIRWGVNRTVAQAHALFYLSPDPLNADDISATLSFSKSSVSTCLRELQGWGLVRPVHLRGDRKQYYEAIKDPWEMFRLILDERRRREIDPTVGVLRECLEEARQTTPTELYATERFHEALEFFELVIPLYDELRRLPRGSIQSFVKLRDQLRSLAEGMASK